MTPAVDHTRGVGLPSFEDTRGLGRRLADSLSEDVGKDAASVSLWSRPPDPGWLGLASRFIRGPHRGHLVALQPLSITH